ncbi:MAG: hypothetical protein OES10_12555 [Gammaproteobacteria bacterium]|nr:hypothetical protein [Gammaproteobacteria bacterium]MDH3749625.1 hypothetical protein [Gammaproteobacteria bacterium]
MRHNTIRQLLTVLAILGSTAALGQNTGSSVLENQELANARNLLQAGRAEIIREDLRLTDEESAGFWPVYDKYHAEIMVVRDRQAKIIAGFLITYRKGALDEEYATGLIKGHFETKGDLLKIQTKFLRQFRKVLPELKVVRFYQLENKMDAEIDAQLALFVPLVEAM